MAHRKRANRLASAVGQGAKDRPKREIIIRDIREKARQTRCCVRRALSSSLAGSMGLGATIQDRKRLPAFQSGLVFVALQQVIAGIRIGAMRFPANDAQRIVADRCFRTLRELSGMLFSGRLGCDQVNLAGGP